MGTLSASDNITDDGSLEKIDEAILDMDSNVEVEESQIDDSKCSQNSIDEANELSANNQTIDAPQLIKVQYYPKNDDFYAKFCWVSQNGSTYEVLRNDSNDYKAIATVTANSGQMTYYDKIAKNCSYTYSVREIKENNNKIIYGLYDVEGLKLIGNPEVNVDFQNLMANVTWSTVDDATKYRVFRKMGRDGEFKCIAVVDANQNSYVDYYYNSANELSSILETDVFLDPSFNNLFYTVRACNIRDDGATSYGLYLKDGDFYLESPSIVSLRNNIIKWGKVPNVDGYLVLKKDNASATWQAIGQAAPKTSTTLSMKLNSTDYNAYYSVQGFALKNGEMAYSNFDEGFSLMNYSDENSQYRILYFGNSITYGSPYKSASSKHIFSYPYRVEQLLGNVYYNPSIPGSTYHDLGQIDGVNIENTNYYRYRICREVVDAIFDGELPGNWEDLDTSKNSEGISNTHIDDYNIVVLAAGTNDYLDNAELGPEDSNNTTTFNGAFNHIMERINEASQIRVSRGETPIKVIFVDLFYSDRTNSYKYRNNRDVTPNKIGLTLCDYQDALNSQYVKWQNKTEYLEFYNFKTRDYEIVNEENCPYTASDNLHFTKYTYGQYGNALAQFLVENVFTYSSNSIPAPQLIKVQYYPKDDDYYAKFCWVSQKGSTYEVLRNDRDDYEIIATLTATSNQMTYYDKISKNCSYTYSVREIKQINNRTIHGLYDVEGLKLINCPNVTVDFQNLIANVTWTKLDDVTKYRVFRKMGRDGEFKCIAVVDASKSYYVDYYYKSSDELSSILHSSTFAESSYNNLFYTVRACNIKTVNGTQKTSYGLYLKDGDFNLESPTIVSLENNVIKWGKVPNADGYYILKKSDEEWEIIGNASQKTSTTNSITLENTDFNAYYSVQAFAIKNGEIVYSNFDEGFSLMNYSEENSNYRILYIGDSITYGSPYKSLSSRHIFSIPNRVAQLIGCVYYNPSIPGSTYHDLGQINGTNILNTDFYRYRICREVVDPISIGELPADWDDLDTALNSEGISNTSIDDYNIVVLAAGTNDYYDNSELGPEDSNNTTTFNGAFNHIMEKIDFASQMRVERGESPIKVIFVDLYYSDRTYSLKVRHNRDVTPNKIGLTLCDYQEELNKQYNKWQNQSEYLTFYNFKTRDYDIVNEENCPYTSSDNLHFTKFTYGQYGNAFARYLSENVFKSSNSTLIADNLVMTYDDGSCWNVTLTNEMGYAISNAEIKIAVNTNDTYTLVTDVNGSVSLPINLAPGTYDINATFEGNYEYEYSFINATITINKSITNLSCELLSMFYKDGSSWNVTLTDYKGNAISGVYVKIGVKGMTYSRITDSNGTASLPINLAIGSYQVNATFEGDSIYESSFVNNTIIVSKNIPVLSGESLSMCYRDGSFWNVTLTDGNGNAISGVYVKIGIVGKTYSRLTDSNGTASLPINLAIGTYAVNATYDGNSRYQSAFINTTITVNKGILTLTGEDLVVGYKEGRLYKVNLTDCNGNPISNINVRFTIGNSNYNAKTDSNGTASLRINLGLGNYTIQTSISDSKYESANITNTITVNTDNLNITANDVNMTYRDGTSYEVQLVDSEGNAVPLSGQIIHVTLKNKTYNLKTNANGIAKLVINLSVGNYTIESRYNNCTIVSNIAVNAQ